MCVKAPKNCFRQLKQRLYDRCSCNYSCMCVNGYANRFSAYVCWEKTNSKFCVPSILSQTSELELMIWSLAALLAMLNCWSLDPVACLWPHYIYIYIYIYKHVLAQIYTHSCALLRRTFLTGKPLQHRPLLGLLPLSLSVVPESL